MSLTSRVLLALVAGLAAGTAASAAASPALLDAISASGAVGTVWVNAIRMTVIPLVVSLLVTGIASTSTSAVGRVGGRAVLIFAVMVGFASLLGALAAPPLLRLIPLDPATVAAIRGGASQPFVELPPFRDWITGLVPANPVQAAADGAMLPLIVFTAVSALALTRVRADRRDLVVRFFEAAAETMFVLVEWILKAAPLGVFFLALDLAARAGVQLAGAIGWFILVCCGLLTVGLLLLYPAVALLGGVRGRDFARACLPAQVVGFSSRSSLAALPAMLEGAERRLGLPVRVTGLALPVAVAIFKYSSPIARITGTLFVARLYGVELGWAEMAAITAALGLLSFYSPGIPSGGLFVITPVYVSFGLPVEGIGLLLALDLIPDMFMTTANVTADMAAATLLSRAEAAAPPAPALTCVESAVGSQ